MVEALSFPGAIEALVFFTLGTSGSPVYGLTTGSLPKESQSIWIAAFATPRTLKSPTARRASRIRSLLRNLVINFPLLLQKLAAEKNFHTSRLGGNRLVSIFLNRGDRLPFGAG